MIEARNLRKKYAPKKGVTVNALDDVSLRLPDTGMVFILGKSGSGKSTLLNVLGGLDTIDSGEILIKGQSSKEFKQSHFDSYRNTYVGFIFQEYNILEEFTVGANIALAIELQGRKATNEEINKILDEVELNGLGARKPNELSGGQKQRVAIARALVKNPEIIMADEPTGALDSVTGRQVFDTLKELSKKKLVLIVSHDREFSELYADRIIELADGKIISDVEYDKEATESGDEPNLSYAGKEITIKDGYELTEADRIAINDYIKKIKSNASLVINDKRQKKIFKNTDENKIAKHSGDGFKLIKSKLSIKNAFKLGSSGLKYKKVRLVFTIILSFIAFSLFGLSDTIASYNSINTCTESLMDSGIDYVSFIKAIKYSWGDGENDFYWQTYDTYVSNEELGQLSKETGLDYIGVIGSYNLSFSSHISSSASSGKDWSMLFPSRFSGVASISPETVQSHNFTLVGDYPANDNEVVITKYVYEYFKKSGFVSFNGDGSDITSVNSEYDLIGKQLTLNGFSDTVKIVGILDTGFDFTRYESLADTNNSGSSVIDYALQSELSSIQQYSLHAVLFTTDNMEKSFASLATQKDNLNEGYFRLVTYKDKNVSLDNDANLEFIYEFWSLQKLSGNENIAWLGSPLSSLGEHQLIIPMEKLSYLIEISLREKAFDFSSIPLCSEDLVLLDFGYSSLDDVTVNFYNAAGYKYVIDAMQNEEKRQAIFDLLSKLGFEEGRFILEDGEYNVGEIANVFVSNVIWSSLRPDDFMDYLKSYYEKTVTNYPDAANYLLSFDVFSEFIATLPSGDYTAYNGNWLDIRLPNLLESSSYVFSFNYAASNYDKALKWYSENLANQDGESSPDGLSVIRSYADYLRSGASSDEVTAFKNYESERLLGIINQSGLIENTGILYGSYKDNTSYETYDAEIVGFTLDSNANYAIVSDKIYSELVNSTASGTYTCVIAPMPSSESEIRSLVEFSYGNSYSDGNVKFNLTNSVTNELDMIDEMLDVLGKVFLWVGLGFALFAALMLSNFIATSISHKKQEIGILRAIGSRSNDVFMIFFAESFIIAMINFVLSLIATGSVVYILNSVFRNDLGILVTFLTFGIRQVLLLLLVSLLVAVIATFLPVRKIASMKPIDAIKNRK